MGPAGAFSRIGAKPSTEVSSGSAVPGPAGAGRPRPCWAPPGRPGPVANGSAPGLNGSPPGLNGAVPGAKGSAGANGSAGPPVPKGSTGAPGANGSAGASA
ncbi:hypothetical protein VR45_40375 [Streptomyces sp. NRRL S-495]|nr:hypothetical protein VR45_40375 [Streptomyces sp. NRRL S-495]